MRQWLLIGFLGFFISTLQAQKVVEMFDGHSLKGWKITNFGPQGPVEVLDSMMVLHIGDGLTGVTWQDTFPQNNYEVYLQAQRLLGNDFFCGVTFPVQEGFCSLILGGWGGALVGISSIDGLDASENELTQYIRFEDNQWYDVRIRVVHDSIKVWLDQVQIIGFKKGNHELSVRNDIALAKPFGISAWSTRAGIRKVRYQMLKP
ncbi:MAG: 3-keto-disaccharide hydrolase [Candidatus Cyclobacteriaceae bacterium M3_2C_046]